MSSPYILSGSAQLSCEVAAAVAADAAVQHLAAVADTVLTGTAQSRSMTGHLVLAAGAGADADADADAAGVAAETAAEKTAAENAAGTGDVLVSRRRDASVPDP